MKTKEIELFVWAKHESGVPWMSAKCCGSRINHQKAVRQLPEVTVYGGALPPDQRTIITHVADYACKCGKTLIEVEGFMKVYEINGCIVVEKP